MRRARADSRGFTLVELAVVIAILGVLLIIAVAALLGARASANEAAAIASLKSINVAQMSYAADCGRGRFAVSLPTLTVSPGQGRAGYLGPEFKGGTTVFLNGYNVTLGASIEPDVGPDVVDCNGARTQTKYYARAVPAGADNGTRAFATNHKGTIWERAGETPPTEPFGPPATPVP